MADFSCVAFAMHSLAWRGSSSQFDPRSLEWQMALRRVDVFACQQPVDQAAGAGIRTGWLLNLSLWQLNP